MVCKSCIPISPSNTCIMISSCGAAAGSPPLLQVQTVLKQWSRWKLLKLTGMTAVDYLNIANSLELSIASVCTQSAHGPAMGNENKGQTAF